MFLPGEADGVLDFGIAYRQRRCLAILKDSEGDWRHFWRLERVAERCRGIGCHGDDLTALERAGHVVPALGLHDNNLSLQGCQSDAGCKPAAPTWNDDALRSAPQLLDNLEADG